MIQNGVDWQDEQSVSAALKRGDIEEAKRIAFAFAPPENTEPEDPKKRKPKKPAISSAHLQSRARVYMGMEDWDAALKNAEEVVKLQTATDGGMSLRTDELDEADKLRDTILQKKEEAKK